MLVVIEAGCHSYVVGFSLLKRDQFKMLGEFILINKTLSLISYPYYSSSIWSSNGWTVHSYSRFVNSFLLSHFSEIVIE